MSLLTNVIRLAVRLEVEKHHRVACQRLKRKVGLLHLRKVVAHRLVYVHTILNPHHPLHLILKVKRGRARILNHVQRRLVPQKQNPRHLRQRGYSWRILFFFQIVILLQLLFLLHP